MWGGGGVGGGQLLCLFLSYLSGLQLYPKGVIVNTQTGNGKRASNTNNRTGESSFFKTLNFRNSNL